MALAGLCKTPKVFYCPSERDILFQYDTIQNVWCFDRNPPSDHLVNQVGPDPGYNNALTRLGYQCRPALNFNRTGASSCSKATFISFDSPFNHETRL